MRKPDRRELLRSGIEMALPVGALLLLGGCQPTADSADPPADDGETKQADAKQPTENKTPSDAKEPTMQIRYLEIVSTEVDALCKQYSDAHGVTFSDPEPMLGGARTAALEGVGQIGIRAPMREGEAPVIRPYMLVDDLKAAVTAAKAGGAEVAIEEMKIEGHGTIAIVIQGGIECGFWQD